MLFHDKNMITNVICILPWVSLKRKTYKVRTKYNQNPDRWSANNNGSFYKTFDQSTLSCERVKLPLQVVSQSGATPIYSLIGV